MKTFAAGLVAASLLAQTPLAFEVASVKPHPWTGQGGFYVMVQGNTLRGEHIDLYGLIEFAYDLKDFQLSGGPAWAKHGVLDHSELFQVAAKPPGDRPATPAQFREMLRTLLAERFQLKIHHAMKDMPVYGLAIAKSGLKMKESAPDAKFAMNIGGARVLHIAATHTPLEKLAGQLGLYAGRPVIDRTGLTGFYDFDLEWQSEDLTSGDLSAPSLVTALQERLGLKLEPGTAPYDCVVIDSASKPSEN